MSFKKVTDESGIFFVSSLISVPHRFTTRTGKPDTAYVTPSKQLHGDRICPVGKNEIGNGPECDGLLCTEPGVTVAIRTADCVPVLLYAEKKGAAGEKERAVCAVHSGWKGSAKNIAGKAVRQLCALGFAPKDVRTAVGACIHACCFEVKQDVIDAFSSVPLVGDLARDCVYHRGDRTFADLPMIVAAELTAAGVPKEQIDVCPECTCCDPSLFYSYRAEGRLNGSMYAMISIG